MIATLPRRSTWLAIGTVSCVLAMEVTSAQTRNAADGPWVGWVRCDITAQGAGYTDRQTHTWVITGGAPRVEGVFRIYPATWTVVGGGSLQTRTQPPSNVTGQWTTNGQSSNAPIAVWMRGDGRIVFTLRHEQLRIPNGFIGSRSFTVDGKQGPGQAIAAETYEYRFQPIDDAPANTISGSSTLAIPSSNAFAPVPQPGSTASAACSWQFVQSATPIAPPTTSSAAATATTATQQVTLSAAGSGGTIQSTATGTSSDTTPKDTTVRDAALSSGALSGVTAALLSTASAEGITATISGPKNLTTGMKGTFNLTLTPTPSDSVFKSANVMFDSNEGETTSLSSSGLPGVLSATFTFQTAGSYAVSARLTETRSKPVVTQKPHYGTTYTYDPSCNCNKATYGVVGYDYVTTQVIEYSTFGVQQQVVVSAP